MKRYGLILAVAVAALLSVAAQAQEETPPPYIPAILIVEDDEAVAELESSGVVIWRRRADMALALIPREMESVRKMRGVRRIEKERKAVPAMNEARQWFGADDILQGKDLPQPFTGKGIVAGFCDTGFDPNHIAFLDSEGKSRVKKLVYYDEPNGVRKIVDTPEAIAAWSTDTPDQWHGTHVANIMAGSHFESGYQGMAPDAEIVATTSMLYDAGILAACEDIIDYAKEVGKPAVINLSLSNYNGPHDGTSLFCRYMEMLGEEAIVVMAAGNAAAYATCSRVDFTAEKPDMRVRFRSDDWTQFKMRGMTDAWSADNRPIGARILVFDEATSECVYRSDAYGLDGETDVLITTDDDPELAKFLTGMVEICAYESELNGRWATEVYYLTETEEVSPKGNWARYVLGLEFCGAPGVHADITSDGIYTYLNTWPGYAAPDTSLSISDIATGENVISVGMYTSRDSWPLLDGSTGGWEGEKGKVNRYSSYGTLLSGKVLPHVVAPGAALVSACNSNYIKKYPNRVNDMSDVTKWRGKKYYWRSCMGTSMSSPFTAGVIAGWLEANPNLTVKDVQEAIRITNVHYYTDPTNPRHGQGWLNPYAGLGYVLDPAGVVAGAADSADAAVVISGDYAEIFNPGMRSLAVTVTGLDGRQAVAPVMVNGTTGRIDLSSLSRGAYVIAVGCGDKASVTKKFLR